jgi:hypothetical protein
LEFVGGCLLNAGNGLSEGVCGSDNPICGCDDGNRHGVVFVSKCVSEVFAPGVGYDGSDASVMLQGRANVPSVCCVEAPLFSLGWFEVNKDFSSWWGHECGIEGNRAFHCLKC